MLLTLIKNLTIEQLENELPIGNLLFKKKDFSLFMNITGINTLEKKFNLQFQVVRTEDQRIIKSVGDLIEISTKGRSSSIVNQSDVDSYLKKQQDLKTILSDAKKSIKSKREEYQEKRKSLSVKRELSGNLKSELSQLNSLTDPKNKDKERIVELNNLIDDTKTEISNIEKTVKKSKSDLDSLVITFNEKANELSMLAEVKPNYLMVDKYEDVVGTYIINNELTESGLVWVKTLPLLDKTVGDFIE